MGIVYEAVDTALDRPVALKMMVIPPQLDPAEAAREELRFLQEARLSAALPRHPNIVGVYEGGVLDGRRYLAMELVRGRPMLEWKAESDAPLRRQVALLRDVALAAHHAHENGIVHRDLKPENILVDGQGRPYITDFGVAKPIRQATRETLTAAGMVIGTPAYMCPEYIRGDARPDRRWDVYSLGVMLYETFTGRTPHEGRTAGEVLAKVLRDPVTPPREACREAPPPELDETMEGICLKALEKSPRRRYATAETFAADLTKWLDGQPVRGVARRGPEATGRRRAVAAALAAAVLLAAAGGLFLHRARAAVEQDLQRAEIALERGRYAEAIQGFGRVLAAEPGHARATAGRKEAETKLAEVRQVEQRAGRIRTLLDEARVSEALRELKALRTFSPAYAETAAWDQLVGRLFDGALPVAPFDDPAQFQTCWVWKQMENTSLSHPSIEFGDFLSVVPESRAGGGAARLVLRGGDAVTLALPALPFPAVEAVMFWARLSDGGPARHDFLIALTDPSSARTCRLEWTATAGRDWRLFFIPLGEFQPVWGTETVEGHTAQRLHLQTHKPMDLLVDEIRLVTRMTPLEAFLGNLGFEKGTLEGWEETAVDGGVARVAREGTPQTGPLLRQAEAEGDYALILRSNELGLVNSVGAVATPLFVPASDTLTFRCVTENPDAVTVEVRILDAARRELRTVRIAETGSAGTTGVVEGAPSVDLSDYRRAKTPVRIEFRQHTKQRGSGWATLIDDIRVEASAPPAGR
jgi:hypothetical protein